MKRTAYTQTTLPSEESKRSTFWKDPGFYGSVVSGLLLVFVVLQLLSPEDGILKVQEVRRIKAQLQDDITQLEHANAQLVADIEAMQTDPFQQEKIAREELNMALPGEIIYKFAE
jgi:cell division protein FtsB